MAKGELEEYFGVVKFFQGRVQYGVYLYNKKNGTALLARYRSAKSRQRESGITSEDEKLIVSIFTGILSKTKEGAFEFLIAAHKDSLKDRSRVEKIKFLEPNQYTDV